MGYSLRIAKRQKEQRGRITGRWKRAKNGSCLYALSSLLLSFSSEEKQQRKERVQEIASIHLLLSLHPSLILSFLSPLVCC